MRSYLDLVKQVGQLQTFPSNNAEQFISPEIKKTSRIFPVSSRAE